MFTITKRYFVWFACSSMLWVPLCPPVAFAQNAAGGQAVGDLAQTSRNTVPEVSVGSGSGATQGSMQGVLPVSMPGSMPGSMPIPTSVPAPVAIPAAMSMPVPVPLRMTTPTIKPVVPNAAPGQECEKLMITQMSGEVHFKHLQDPRIDPARALYIETGNTPQSFCECRMRDCTARAWKDSQVSVFPDSGVLYLNKGALIVKVSRNPEAVYTVIAGDLMCRVPAGTLRIQRTDRFVTFQVLEGTLTVYNRQTGQITRATQQFNSPANQQQIIQAPVTQPAH